MRAVKAIVHGAVSILNAIPTGVGGALGVNLRMEAIARLTDDLGRIEARIPENEDPGLVIETAKTVLEYAGKGDLGLFIETRSNIPIGKGLKSSSAASDAVALAVAKLIGLEAPPELIVKLAVDASIKAGVTLTGAYDDAYTCFFGGINIVNNYDRKILLRRNAPSDISVLILVPEEKIYTRSVDLKELNKVRELCMKAKRLALKERFWDAMTLNGLAIAAALDLDVKPILSTLRAGAYAVGVSGTGPAVAAVASLEKLDEVRKTLESFGRVSLCKPNNSQAYWEMLNDG